VTGLRDFLSAAATKEVEIKPQIVAGKDGIFPVVNRINKHVIAYVRGEILESTELRYFRSDVQKILLFGFQI
jgi:hypothetical protein